MHKWHQFLWNLRESKEPYYIVHGNIRDIFLGCITFCHLVSYHLALSHKIKPYKKVSFFLAFRALLLKALRQVRSETMTLLSFPLHFLSVTCEIGRAHV